jgi:protein subunit release factor A
MLKKLDSIEKRYDQLNGLLSDPQIIAQQSEYKKYAREQSELAPIVAAAKVLKIKKSWPRKPMRKWWRWLRTNSTR